MMPLLITLYVAIFVLCLIRIAWIFRFRVKG